MLINQLYADNFILFWCAVESRLELILAYAEACYYNADIQLP